MLLYEPIIWFNLNDLFLLLPIDFIYLFFLLYIALAIIIIGFFGFIYQGRSIIHMLLSIELILLGLHLIIIFIVFFYNNIQGLLLLLFLMTLAAGESAIGLSLLIVFYRTRQATTIELFSRLQF
jgi:NADH:ubiquinone oxidoreductase subunit K